MRRRQLLAALGLGLIAARGRADGLKLAGPPRGRDAPLMGAPRCEITAAHSFTRGDVEWLRIEGGGVFREGLFRVIDVTNTSFELEDVTDRGCRRD